MGVVMGLIVYGPQGCGKSTRAQQIVLTTFIRSSCCDYY